MKLKERYFIIILFSVISGFTTPIRSQQHITIINTDPVQMGIDTALILLAYFDELNQIQMNRLMERCLTISDQLDAADTIYYDLYDTISQPSEVIVGDLAYDIGPLLIAEAVAALDNDPGGENTLGVEQGANFNPVPQTKHQKTFNRLNTIKYILNTSAQYQDELDSAVSKSDDTLQEAEEDYVETDGAEGASTVESLYTQATAVKSFVDDYASAQILPWCFIQLRMFDRYQAASIRDSLKNRIIANAMVPAASGAAKLASQNDTTGIGFVQSIFTVKNNTD